jgi:fatty acid desaturase
MPTSDFERASARAEAPRADVEWPTLLVAAAIYGGWLLATLGHAAMPWPIRAAIGGWLIAWHGSLQHEVIHGHPTPWRRANTLIGSIPLSLWLPFERYRSSHLAHHASEQITEPGRDPESRYLKPGPGLSATLDRFFSQLQATLLGRMIFGPIIDVARFALSELSAEGRRGALRAWAPHAFGVLAVAAWLKLVCGMSLVDYALTFVYPGAALTLIRSFAEHRADPSPDRRVAVVERAPLLGLLFLNNNLHAVHHRHPGRPWYRLPGLYWRDRQAILEANGGLAYAGYREVFRRYLLRPHDVVVHPSFGDAEASAG